MEQSKIWNYYQNDDSVGEAAFSGARSRYDHLAQKIAPGMSALNIGVGRGGLETILLRRGVVTSCLDPSEEAIAALREKLGIGDSARVGFSNAIPFGDAQFDVVVMTEVLEHLDDQTLRDTLREVGRVLKPDGRFIGTVPADENLLDSRVMCPHCGEQFHRWGHVQNFTRERIDSVLKAVFLQVVVSREYFGDFRILNFGGRLAWAIKKLRLKLGRAGSNETFSFVAGNR